MTLPAFAKRSFCVRLIFFVLFLSVANLECAAAAENFESYLLNHPGKERAARMAERVASKHPEVKSGRVATMRQIIMEADLPEEALEDPDTVSLLLSMAKKDAIEARRKVLWAGGYLLFSLVAIIHLLSRVYLSVIFDKKSDL